MKITYRTQAAAAVVVIVLLAGGVWGFVALTGGDNPKGGLAEDRCSAGNTKIERFTATPSSGDSGDTGGGRSAADTSGDTGDVPAELSWAVSGPTDSLEIDQGVGKILPEGRITVTARARTVYTLTAKCAGQVASGVVTIGAAPRTASTPTAPPATAYSVTYDAPKSYSGTDCTRNFDFTFKIAANRAGTVRYRIERSDGTLGAQKSLTFAAPGTKSIFDRWGNLAFPEDRVGWERVKILAPVTLTSDKAMFTAHCVFTVTKVTASVSPSTSSECDQTFTFTGAITVNKAGRVTYEWVRSDGGGAAAPAMSYTFARAGTYTFTTTWEHSEAYEGWQAVKVLTPKASMSSHANFTKTECGAGGP